MSELNILPSDRRDETARVLRLLTNGLIISSTLVAPNILLLLSNQLRSPFSEEAKTLRAIRYAKSRGWLTLRDTAQGVEVALSATGKLKWQKVELEQPLATKKWDKKWRVVMFDIPLAQKNNSEVFRNHLKRLGFLQLQKSVWITPYPCSTIIAALRQIYEIRYNVRVLEVVAIDNEADLKNSFHLQK